MASRSNQSEEVQKEVEAEITCPACHDHFQDQELKILPCLHYYCKQCIQTLAQRAGAHQPFPCPECRKVTHLPQNDPNLLPTAFFVNHVKEKAHAGHKVMTLDLEGLAEGEAKPPSLTCKDHDKQMNIYCYGCNCFICQECTVIDHKEHKYDFVKKKLMKHLAPLKEIQVGLRDAAKTIKSTKSDIKTQSVSVATAIAQSFDKLHDSIKQHKQEQLEKASNVTKEKLQRLSLQEEEFEIFSSVIQSLVCYAEQNIENATEEELMTIHTQMLDWINEETKKHQQSSLNLEPVEEASMEMEVSCVEKLRKICIDKVKLKTGIECTMEGHPANKLYAEVDKPSKVKMTFTLPNGMPLAIEAKLISSQDGSAIQAKVQQKQGCTYKIEYVPQIRGHHKLEITANNIPVTGSPFPVVVKIPPTQLGKPVNIISGVVQRPISIAINSAGEMLVAEEKGDVVVLDKTGKRVHSIKRSQYDFKQTNGITLDSDDNVYVTDYHSHGLFKFDKNYKLVKKIILKDFAPCGVTVVDEHVIVTQSHKPAFVFTRNLELIRVISCANGQGIAHDDNRNLYICDHEGHKIHTVTLEVLDHDIKYSFGDKHHIKTPFSICVDGDLVYVTDWNYDTCVSVFTREGMFVTSFGSHGQGKGCFMLPTGLAVDADGILYVCDYLNDRLQLF